MRIFSRNLVHEQTDKQTNAGDYITSFAEITTTILYCVNNYFVTIFANDLDSGKSQSPAPDFVLNTTVAIDLLPLPRT